ncbi:transposase [Bacillus cereus]|uniref:RNA-guided endonuclease InsQ/TnpB family protein n=1 Tax=Bacillus cereus TaxID=1396 RepID=UPI000BFB5F07|nr:RNA-guided endonuclease TnpB family protein [Bacillus cereus]PGP14489.1 transposase [Bacillus cereus]
MRAYKTEIVINEKQRVKLINTFGVCRFLYNAFISHNKDLYEKEDKFCSGMEFDKYVNNVLSIEKPWIKDVSSKARKKAIMNGDTAFKRFFKGTSKFPKFKKKNKQDVKVYFPKNNKSDLLVERHRIKVPTLGWVVLKEKGYIPTNAIVSSCTIEQKANRFFISVFVKEETKANLQEQCQHQAGVGIDFGIKELAVTSDGKKFKNINKTKRIKRLEKRLRREQRSLSRKYEFYKKGGKSATEERTNLHKNILRVQKIHHRLTNIRNAYLDYVIRELTKTKPPFITLEKLNVKGMMKNRHLSKAIANQKFYEFKTRLINKCKKLKIELREVPLFYPSSKLCSACGKKKTSFSLSERVFTCECGHVMDRDENAAINLQEAKTYTILT